MPSFDARAAMVALALWGCGGETASQAPGTEDASADGAAGASGSTAGSRSGSGGSAIGGSGGTTGGSGGTTGGSGGSAGAFDAGDASVACSSSACLPRTCAGKLFECGDCVDNDGDGRTDADDPECLGACHNSEAVFELGIPSQSAAPCNADCYFDHDKGSGNDGCFWTHKCDPLSVPPDHPPEGSDCPYTPDAGVPGTPGTCSDLLASQSRMCLSFCEPITPNGCDCFGCCKVAQAPTPIWLGSVTSSYMASCSSSTLADPTLCKPCTIVPSCFNPCDECELCVGKQTLPPQCGTQDCSSGIQKCGLEGQACCPAGSYCVSGCCQPVTDF